MPTLSISKPNISFIYVFYQLNISYEFLIKWPIVFFSNGILLTSRPPILSVKAYISDFFWCFEQICDTLLQIELSFDKRKCDFKVLKMSVSLLTTYIKKYSKLYSQNYLMWNKDNLTTFYAYSIHCCMSCNPEKGKVGFVPKLRKLGDCLTKTKVQRKRNSIMTWVGKLSYLHIIQSQQEFGFFTFLPVHYVTIIKA